MDDKKMNRFIIFSAGYNCGKYIYNNIKSVDNQTYKNYIHIVIDDASTDNTFDTAMLNMGNRRFVFRNKENQKWIYNAIKYLDSFIENEEDIIITLDLDDWLSNNNVLEIINNTYEQKKCWMTYSLFVYTSNGAISSWIRPYTEFDYMGRNYRKNLWSFTHLRSFKAFLWDNLNKDDLKDQYGNYFKSCYDRAIFYPMLEMSSPSKIEFINQVLYVYNDLNPLQVEKINRNKQEQIKDYIDNKPKYKRLYR